MTPHVNPKNLGEISKFRNFLHPEFSKFHFLKFIFKVLIDFGWNERDHIDCVRMFCTFHHPMACVGWHVSWNGVECFVCSQTSFYEAWEDN